MTEYLIKPAVPAKVEDNRLLVYSEAEHGWYGVPIDCVEEISTEKMANIRSMHQYGLLLESRDREIKQLKLDVAAAKIGGQPASKVRDLVLVALEQVQQELEGSVGTTTAKGTIGRIIQALGANIPGKIEYRPKAGVPAESQGVKPYKALDHGVRDLGGGAGVPGAAGPQPEHTVKEKVS